MASPPRVTHELRAAFASSLSAMYGREVPAYLTLVDVAGAVNADVLLRDPVTAQRLGSIERVTTERHGAIRLGTRTEMRQVARVFAALGMHPVGFYDLRDASASSVPVVSTAFRPVDPDELARNPFRVFTSLLTADDPRFFDTDLQRALAERLDARRLFSPELLALADRAAADGGLDAPDADRFLALATGVFRLSPEPVDRSWYARLEAVSGVAADIGGVGSTHINHLTPRVLDIDELYRRMTDRGIAMIDAIQGPPRWEGPDVLLRQTSFRALAEPRRFREDDGSVVEGQLRVRFGEVEARGIALTGAGRERYDALLAEVDDRVAADPGADRAVLAAQVWREGLPPTEAALDERGLGFFTYRAVSGHPDSAPPETLGALLADGWAVREPIVYEDFLPRSAAGIFRSNLDRDDRSRTARSDSSDGSVTAGATDGASEDGRDGGRDLAWMSEVLDREVPDPMDLYAAQRAASLRALADRLDLDPTTLADRTLLEVP